MRTSQILEERMELRSDWKPMVTVDMVLRGAGADPKAIRERQPGMVALANRAIVEGTAWIHPLAALRSMPVHDVHGARVLLENGAELRGAGVASQLAGAKSIVAVVATIGKKLEHEIERLRERDVLYQLVLDGFGTAAIGEFVHLIARDIEAKARATRQKATNPLYPGSNRWELSDGQRQIFSLVDSRMVGVSLNASFMMTPRKSASFLIGLGPKVRVGNDLCEECDASNFCRHKRPAH
jgi:hypothetical protein